MDTKIFWMQFEYDIKKYSMSEEDIIKYDPNDYIDACRLALNLNISNEIRIRYYDSDKDLFSVMFLDDGWYTINLTGSLIRACLKGRSKTWIL